jgi:DNA processing protein
MITNDDHFLSAVLRPGLLDPAEVNQALNYFGSAEELFKSPEARLRLVGLSPHKTTKLRAAWQALDPATEAFRLENTSTATIRLNSPFYPTLLRETPDPPPMLFVRGNPQALLNEHKLSIVGSRKMTPYGEAATRQLVAPCVRRGITIVSGLAFGVDAAAHWVTMHGKGSAVAVLASGVDRETLGPKANLRLADEIVATDGCLISERPPGAPADKRAFPLRNRIVAGLAGATLIIEAAERSGSLITARLSLELGRDVLAVPGPITSPLSAGSNRLISEGATPALEANDLFQALNLPQTEPGKPTLKLNENQTIIIKLLSEKPQLLDDLAEKCRLPINQTLTALSELEEADIIRQTGEFVALTNLDN